MAEIEAHPVQKLVRQSYCDWLGEPAFVLPLRHADPRVPPLEVLFFQPPGQEDLPEGEHVTYIVTAGMSIARQQQDPARIELFMRVNAVVPFPQLEALGRALATLATLPFREDVTLSPNMVLDDVRLPVFDRMNCALLTHWAVQHPRWICEEVYPVLLINVVPLFRPEADVVHEIGDAEAYRRFLAAGINWYAPSRPAAGLRVPQSTSPSLDQEKTAMREDSASASGSTVEQVWQEIEAWLREHAPALLDRLGGGASEEVLQQLESETGISLPQDYRGSLKRHDGGLSWGSYEYLPAAEVHERWKSLSEMEEQGSFTDAEVALPEDGRVTETWWSRGWIPIAADSGGNLICIDMAPGPNGTAGQVIKWETVDGPAPTQHQSFVDWLSAFRDDLAGGKYEVTDDETLRRTRG